MTYGERERIYKKVIDTYGPFNQAVIAMEEMSEIIKELSENYRGKKNKESIAEEVADVTIMLEQLSIIYEIKDEVEREMKRKLDRLDKALEGAKYGA